MAIFGSEMVLKPDTNASLARDVGLDRLSQGQLSLIISKCDYPSCLLVYKSVEIQKPLTTGARPRLEASGYPVRCAPGRK